MIYIVAHWCGG